jgi:UDPglucose 6-dehydrogenase
MGLDPRIGHDFLNAGIGYGGSCFPKDVRAVLAMANECDVQLTMLQETQHVNNSQHAYFLSKVREDGDLQGKIIAVLGLAFKPNTSDVRESPALSIIQALSQVGSLIKVHDPVAKLPSWMVEQERIVQCQSPVDAADGADILLICTDWPEYRDDVDWQAVKCRMHGNHVYDGRNMLDANVMRSLGFVYRGIGYP